MNESVRLATPGDLDDLADIERSAAQKFYREWTGKSSPYNNTLPREKLEVARAQGTLWLTVDVDVTVGFLAAHLLDGGLHIDEISVDYAHQGQGRGRDLMETIIAEAERLQVKTITLTTDSAIPWNAPFYTRLGFVQIPLEDCPPGVKEILLREKKHANTPDNRIAMRLSCNRTIVTTNLVIYRIISRMIDIDDMLRAVCNIESYTPDGWRMKTIGAFVAPDKVLTVLHACEGMTDLTCINGEGVRAGLKKDGRHKKSEFHPELRLAFRYGLDLAVVELDKPIGHRVCLIPDEIPSADLDVSQAHLLTASKMSPHTFLCPWMRICREDL